MKCLDCCSKSRSTLREDPAIALIRQPIQAVAVAKCSKAQSAGGLAVQNVLMLRCGVLSGL